MLVYFFPFRRMMPSFFPLGLPLGFATQTFCSNLCFPAGPILECLFGTVKNFLWATYTTQYFQTKRPLCNHANAAQPILCPIGCPSLHQKPSTSSLFCLLGRPKDRVPRRPPPGSVRRPRCAGACRRRTSLQTRPPSPSRLPRGSPTARSPPHSGFRLKVKCGDPMVLCVLRGPSPAIPTRSVSACYFLCFSWPDPPPRFKLKFGFQLIRLRAGVFFSLKPPSPGGVLWTPSLPREGWGFGLWVYLFRR